MSFAEKTEKIVDELIDEEYLNAIKKYGDGYHSLHEGYAVLREEMDEVKEGYSANELFINILWSNIKGKPNHGTNDDCLNKMLHNVKHTIKELAQVGAVLRKMKHNL